MSPMTERTDIAFAEFVRPAIGLPVSHVWRGYGSAMFLELGELSAGRVRRDGSIGNPRGEWAVMIEWSWRLEGRRRIWCGSWSDEEKWMPLLGRLIGSSVTDFGLIGRLPELLVDFSDGLHLMSMMTAEGQPQWGLVDYLRGMSAGVEYGRVVVRADENGRAS
ncbi:MAG TPA: hypothetical protein VFA99_05235 [Acidobacteriaceae bacterium]|nr:hypothetical protein [Acidobacteriaceae bacterium]